MIDVRGDRRFSGHGPLRRSARFDRVELAKQAGITRVEQIRLLARRAIENLRQHVGQSRVERRESVVVIDSPTCAFRRRADRRSAAGRGRPILESPGPRRPVRCNGWSSRLSCGEHALLGRKPQAPDRAGGSARHVPRVLPRGTRRRCDGQSRQDATRLVLTSYIPRLFHRQNCFVICVLHLTRDSRRCNHVTIQMELPESDDETFHFCHAGTACFQSKRV